MKPKAYRALQFVLWIVCGFHILIGAGLNLAPGFVDTAAGMYGAQVAEWSPQFLYILRPLGVFMLALGCLAACAAWRPLQHRMTIYVFVGIFVIRALQRLFFGPELNTIFGIGSARNTTNMIFFFGLAAVLVILDVQARRAALADTTSSL